MEVTKGLELHFISIRIRDLIKSWKMGDTQYELVEWLIKWMNRMYYLSSKSNWVLWPIYTILIRTAFVALDFGFMPNLHWWALK